SPSTAGRGVRGGGPPARAAVSPCPVAARRSRREARTPRRAAPRRGPHRRPGSCGRRAREKAFSCQALIPEHRAGKSLATVTSRGGAGAMGARLPTTERIVFRRIRPEDAELFDALDRDPGVLRFIAPAPPSLRDQRAKIRGLLREYERHPLHGRFVAES